MVGQFSMPIDSSYIQRTIEPVLRRAARGFAAVVLTGPRQSGKTTLLQHVFDATHSYVPLEPPDVRAAADPRGFLALYPPPVIFDEVQYAPDLLPYIKEHIDAHRTRAGQFLLTGSQNLLMMERVTESLAGRAAMLRLLPLSQLEAIGRPRSRLPWETRTRAPGVVLFRGGNYSAVEMVDLLRKVLDAAPAEDLATSICVVDRQRIRYRRLPIR